MTILPNILRSVFFASIWLGGVTACLHGALAHDDEAERLEQYLTSLKLNRLVIEQLEFRLTNQLDREQRIRDARRLVELYADELLDSRIEIEAADRWADKATALTKIYPSLENPRLEAAILQARYLSEEKSFRLWSNMFPRAPAEIQLNRWLEVERQLQRFCVQLETRYRELTTAIQVHDSDTLLTQQLAQTETLLLHANFLAGWASYYCGVLDPTNRESWLLRSDEHFRDFFQLELRKPMTEFGAKWFDFKSGWQVRGLLGLAMCQQGLLHPQQSQHCFELIAQNANEDTRQRLPGWKLNSHLYLSQYDSALKYVKEHCQENTKPSGQPAEMFFWQAVLNTSVELKNRSPDLASEFARVGLAGALRNSQTQLLESYLEKSPAELADDFLGNWVRGYLYFQQANLTTVTADRTIHFAMARKALEKAIEKFDARNSEIDLAHCRLMLAKIDFRERCFEKSADRFNQVVGSLLLADRELAAESQFLAAQSLIELSRSDNRYTTAAHASLDSLIRRFPESEFAERGEFEKLRLTLAVLPAEESIRWLQRIEPTDSNFLFSLSEIARYRFQIWQEASRGIVSNRELRLIDLNAAVAAVRAQRGIRADRQLPATLLLVNALLRTDPLPESRIREELKRATELLGHVSTTGSESEIEFHYYQMQFAERLRDFPNARMHAEWIVSNAAESRFEMSALVYLAKFWKQEMNSTDRRTELQQAAALPVYRRLVEVSGTNPEQLQRSKNAQVALSNLAELELAMNQFSASAEHFQQLLNSFPIQQTYVLGLAKSKMQLGELESAAPLWRRLSTSAQAGTDTWYEAKHELIVCLLSYDRSAAEKIHRQTLQLSPDIPEPWRTKFSDLWKKLGN